MEQQSKNKIRNISVTGPPSKRYGSLLEELHRAAVHCGPAGSRQETSSIVFDLGRSPPASQGRVPQNTPWEILR